MNLNEIWQAALGTIQMQTSRQDFDTWLRGTNLVSLDGGLATIEAPSPDHKEGLENRYLAPVRRSLGDVVGFPVHVRFILSADRSPLHRNDTNTHHRDPADRVPDPNAGHGSMHNGNGNGNGNGQSPVHKSEPTHTEPVPRIHDMVQLDFNQAMRVGMLNEKYTFSNFIEGASNRLARAACMAVSEHPARAYNPLFVYGGVGLGKTHLMHAIGNYVLDRSPETSVLYVSSEEFTNDLIYAIRHQRNEEFRGRYRSIDILLIDDIQFIAGKDATQEELFHTFNTLHAAARQIVLSSDRPPRAILTLEERLRSRFEWGLIVDVQPPDLETRTAILQSKADYLDLRVPADVIDFLALKIQSNIRELEGSLNRVQAFAQLNSVPITLDVALTALSELLDSKQRRRITADMILHAVSEYYEIELRALQGPGRSRKIAVPRQVAMYLLREETESSFVEIGNLLGHRDHTTVMYGYEKVAAEIKEDTRLRSEVMTIREKLHRQPGL